MPLKCPLAAEEDQVCVCLSGGVSRERFGALPQSQAGGVQ